MSRIDDLIAEFCPNGVESKTLGEVGELIRGRRFTKADYVAEGLGSIHYGEIYTEYGTWATEVCSFVRPELNGNLRLARTGDLVIAATGENVKDVCKAVAWLGADEIAIHDDCYIFRHDLDPKYVSYFFQSSPFQEQKAKFATESKLARISGVNLAKINIPVPPAAVQREIVTILDKMEMLKAELEAELEYRSRQYAHYRDSLLAFAERGRVRWAKLSDVGQFIRGKRFTKADYEPDGIGCIHYGEIYTHFRTSATEVVSHLRPEISDGLRYAEPGDVVIVDVGETVGDVGKAVAWIGDEPVAIHDHSYAFRHELNPSYVSYVMQTGWFMREKLKYIARTKVNTLMVDGFSKIEIPVPEREEQDRIVAVLDKFDALVNDLSRGLPAEIAARRQQYEYYRDKLLTFEEAA
jgi:type I restriction enzyme S subunit